MLPDVNTLFQKLKKATRSSAEERHGPAKSGEQLRSVIDFTKAKNLMGWTPKVSLDQGLDSTVEFFKKKNKGND